MISREHLSDGEASFAEDTGANTVVNLPVENILLKALNRIYYEGGYETNGHSGKVKEQSRAN